MKVYNSDSLKEKRIWRELFRRGMCLLLAIIMVLPAGGGVFAAEDGSVGEALLSEATEAIKIAHKSEIDKAHSAIWWTKDVLAGKVPTEPSPREKTVFLAALLNNLGFVDAVFEEQGDPVIYSVKVTILGERYAIDASDGSSNPKIPENQLEEFQSRIDRDIKTMESYQKELGVLANIEEEKLKEIADRTIVINGNIKNYTVELYDWILREIGQGKSFDDIDESIKSLEVEVKHIAESVFAKALTYETVSGVAIAEEIAPLTGREPTDTDLAIQSALDDIKKKGLQDQVDNLNVKIRESNGTLERLATVIADLKSIDAKLNEIKNQVAVYESEVRTYENTLKMIKDLAKEANITGIEYNEINRAIERMNQRLDNADKLTSLHEAILAVKKAEESNAIVDISNADVLVEALSSGKLSDDTPIEIGTEKHTKATLMERMKPLEEIVDNDNANKALDVAIKAVIFAETQFNKYADGKLDIGLLNAALKIAMDKMEIASGFLNADKDELGLLGIRLGEEDTDDNTGLYLKRDKIKAALDAIGKLENHILAQEDMDALKAVVAKENEKYTNDQIEALETALTAGKTLIRKPLNTRLADIYKVLEAISAINIELKNLTDIKTARSIVSKLNKKFDPTKAIMNAYITEEEDWIKSEEPKTSVEALEKAYDDVMGSTATSTEIAVLIKTAKTLIGKETDNIEKIKMNAVINAIDTAQKAKEAVALAEATKLRKDFNKADGLVRSISENKLYYIEDSLTTLKTELNNKLIPILEAINLLEATAAVVKAENSLKQKDYDLAFTAIGLVEDGPEKNGLRRSLDFVKSVIDATNAVAKAVSAVNDASKSSKDIDNSEKVKAADAAIEAAKSAIAEIAGNDKYKINIVTMNRTVDKLSIISKALKSVKLLSDVQQKSDTSEETYNQALINANTEVSNVTDSKVRSDLEAGIKAIEARQDAAGSVKSAEEKLVAAEKLLNSLLLEPGYKTGSESDTIYNPVKDRTNFEATIKDVQDAIDKADAEIKILKDKRTTEFKNRLLAVIGAKDAAVLIAKAEASDPLVKSEVDAATKALPKVKEDIVKDGDKTIINHKEIKTYLDARVKYLNAALIRTQQSTEAKKLTDKAFDTIAERDIKNAIEYVAKMQNIEDKGKFNTGVNEDSSSSPRIYGIVEILDKFAKATVDKNINDAISGLQMDLKSGSKPVSNAKKSTDVYTGLVNLADSRLGKNSVQPPTGDDLIEYGGKEYEDKISIYNTNNAALAKAQQVWQQIAKADKSKSVSDMEMLDTEFKLLEGILEGTGEFKPKYYVDNTDGVYKGGLLGSLYGEINRIKNFQEGEKTKKADADAAILKVIATLRKYADAKDIEEKKVEEIKKAAREQLPIDIGEVRKIVATIDASDKAALKEYNAKIALMELYRDAINKINRAQISCTPANVKDANAAVVKVDKAKDNGDYIFLNVVLVREIDELYERLVNEESAEQAKILVDKAWQTKTQIDFDIANNAVTRLPENNEAQKKIKADLMESLVDLKKIIDGLEETDRKAVAGAEEALKEALGLIYESKIQNIDPSKDEINEAYARLTGRGIDGIENENPEENTHFAEYYIKRAKDYTNSIVRALDAKNALLEIIVEREHLLKVYSEEILIKEARRLIVKADASVILRNSMPKETAEERKAWEKQTVEANGDLDSAAIAIKRINLPENFDARQRLLERLGLITNDLNTGTTTDKIGYINGLLREATKRVADARDVFEKGDVNGKLMTLLTEAKNLVGDIEIEIEMLVTNNESEQSAKGKLKELVAALRQNVTNIENGVSDKDLIAIAEKAIKAAEDRVKKKEYESAKIDIMEAEMNTDQISDTNAIKRNELRFNINKLKNVIAEATGGEETPPLDDQNDPKIVAKALQLYYKAKASLLQKDIDAARKYINENMVHNTTLKQWLLTKLAEFEKNIVGINKPGDIEEAKRKEEEKKRKAEEVRRKKYPGIDDALDSRKRDTSNSDAKWGDEKGFKKK